MAIANWVNVSPTSENKNVTVSCTAKDNSSSSTSRSTNLSVQGNNVSKNVKVFQDGVDRNVYLSYVDYFKVNNKSINTTINNSDYNPDNHSESIGVSVDQNPIPIRGTISFKLFIDSYFYSLGSPYFAFGGNYYENSLKDQNTNYFDGDGNPIDISDYFDKHEMIYMETTIDYDFSLDGISVGQNMIDFGISLNCSDVNFYTVMWITWPYGITTGN